MMKGLWLLVVLFCFVGGDELPRVPTNSNCFYVATNGSLYDLAPLHNFLADMPYLRAYKLNVWSLASGSQEWVYRFDFCSPLRPAQCSPNSAACIQQGAHTFVDGGGVCNASYADYPIRRTDGLTVSYSSSHYKTIFYLECDRRINFEVMSAEVHPNTSILRILTKYACSVKQLPPHFKNQAKFGGYCERPTNQPIVYPLPSATSPTNSTADDLILESGLQAFGLCIPLLILGVVSCCIFVCVACRKRRNARNQPAAVPAVTSSYPSPPSAPQPSSMGIPQVPGYVYYAYTPQSSQHHSGYYPMMPSYNPNFQPAGVYPPSNYPIIAHPMASNQIADDEKFARELQEKINSGI